MDPSLIVPTNGRNKLSCSCLLCHSLVLLRVQFPQRTVFVPYWSLHSFLPLPLVISLFPYYRSVLTHIHEHCAHCPITTCRLSFPLSCCACQCLTFVLLTLAFFGSKLKTLKSHSSCVYQEKSLWKGGWDNFWRAWEGSQLTDGIRWVHLLLPVDQAQKTLTLCFNGHWLC